MSALYLPERFVVDRELEPGPPPVEVLRYWRAKGLKIGFDHRDVWREEHDYAFSAAKIMREDVLEAMRDELDQAFAEGKPFAAFAESVEPRMKALGWWDVHEVQDPETGDVVEVNPPRRLATIFETNMRTARAVGQYDRVQRNKDTRPFLLYQVGPSKKHREQHLAWHGLLLPVDDPFWAYAWPPNGWGCKCHVRTVSELEHVRLVRNGVNEGEPEPILDDDGLPTGHVKQKRIAVRTRAPEVPLVPWENKRTGQVELVRAGIDPGFDKLPGEGRRHAVQSRDEAPKRELSPLEKRRIRDAIAKQKKRNEAAGRPAETKPVQPKPSAADKRIAADKKALEADRKRRAALISGPAIVPKYRERLITDQHVRDYNNHMTNAMRTMPKENGVRVGAAPVAFSDWMKNLQTEIAGKFNVPVCTPLFGGLHAQGAKYNSFANATFHADQHAVHMRMADDRAPPELRTAVHELIHSTGGALGPAYKAAGRALEEATTEELAQVYMGTPRRFVTAPRRIDVSDPKKAADDWTYAGTQMGTWVQEGSYTKWRDKVFRAVGSVSKKGVTDEQLHDRVVGAMVNWKQKLYDTPEEAVTAFVDALKPASDNERTFLQIVLSDVASWGDGL